MRVYIVAKTPSIRKALGSKECPFPIFHTTLEAAREAREGFNRRFLSGWKIYAVEAEIVEEVDRPSK